MNAAHVSHSGQLLASPVLQSELPHNGSVESQNLGTRLAHREDKMEAATDSLASMTDSSQTSWDEQSCVQPMTQRAKVDSMLTPGDAMQLASLASTPDIPSRRSSRKKQSTFSSDFEYYTPGGKRISLNSQSSPSPKVRRVERDESDSDYDDKEEEEDDSNDAKHKSNKTKLGDKNRKGKPSDEEEEDEHEKLTPSKGKVKVAVKKQGKKGGSAKKITKRKSSEEESEEVDSEEDDSEDDVTLHKLKVQTQTKNLKEGKKVKTQDVSSEDEDSTPISQLKAQLSQKKGGGGVSSQGPGRPPGSAQKRKISPDGSGIRQVPAKVLKAEQLEKFAPALAKLVKNLPLAQLKAAKMPSSLGSSMTDAGKEVSGERKAGQGDQKVGTKLSTESKLKHKMKVEDNKPLKTLLGVDQKVKSGEGKKEYSHESALKKKSKGPAEGSKEIRHVTKVRIIKKADGTIIKKKILVPVDGRGQDEKVKIKTEGKTSPQKNKLKASIPGQKVKVLAEGGSKHMSENVANEGKQKAKTEVSGQVHIQTLKKLGEESIRKKQTKQNVEDLLKRGIVHKKKSHQPFGNKNLVRVSKDVKVEAQVKPKTTVQKGDVQKQKDTELKHPSQTPKQVRDRSQSQENVKKTKSESVKKKLEKSASTVDKDKDEDEPPTLLPATAVKHKHKHHKSEHEVPLDMTMLDLFKPDLPLHPEPKKDEVLTGDQLQGSSKEGHSSESCSESQSNVRSEHVYNIMIEHQYSKPSSPVMQSQESQVGRDDDIESISHKQGVLMDMNMPEQFLEESDEPGPGHADNTQETRPDARDELQHLLARRDAADRPSILESLDSELKESGTEFRIVGQVEVGRIPAMGREENVSTSRGSAAKTEETSSKADHTSSVIKDKTEHPSGGIKDKTDHTNSSIKDKTDHTSSSHKDKTDHTNSSHKDKTDHTSTGHKDKSDHNSGSHKDRTDHTNSGHKDRTDHTSGGHKDRSKTVSSSRKLSSETRSKPAEKDGSVSRRKSQTSEGTRGSLDDRKPANADRNSSTDRKKSSSDNRKSSLGDKNERSKKQPKTSTKPSSAEFKEESESDDAEGAEEEAKFDDDDNDLDWEPTDTDTLYCLCRKPHNNRFMICCDKCEEWFHGTCVGVTRSRGKEMEDNEEEYICPFCARGERLVISDKTVSPEQSKSKPVQVQKCVVRKCNRVPRPGSVYCSNECIMSHAQESLKIIREEQMRRKNLENSSRDSNRGSSSTSSLSLETVEVIEKESGKILSGTSAPTQKGLHRWLEQHPTFEVVQPHRHRSKGSSSSSDKQSRSDKDKKLSSSSHKDRDRHGSDKDRKSERSDGKSRHESSSSKDSSSRGEGQRQSSSSSQKSEVSGSSKSEERKDEGPNQIRLNVRTALRDCLAARAQEADDILLSSNEIKNLAVTIEEELFAVFNDTGHKYRTKYRSLVFNIKDQKNKGLFRKILTGKVKPHKLVLMSSEDLASKELAKWRELESKHQIEMIEKTEQEALKESAGMKHVRKKTHKGEVEVEEEDLSILETRLEEKKDPEPEPQEEQISVPVIDTTDQHRAHLFDLNCKVCTGKIVPGREEQAVAGSSEVSTSQTLVSAIPLPEEPKADIIKNDEKDDYDKAEEIVKEALRTMQKMEASVSLLPKIASSSPSPEEVAPPLSPRSPPQPEAVRRESSSSSASSVSSSSIKIKKKVVVRSPDSALQSGLEAKPKYTPTGPVLWKGLMTMLEVAKFFASAYRVSGPTEHIIIPDTVNILGRISPDHMWDYLSKIRQAGSKDLTIVRFVPGNDDETVAYVHLYSYLNSRGRCGVASNPNKSIKDFYIVPLASHSKIPRTLLPFDGPGLEENRPHMLIGVLVRQRGKHSSDSSTDSSSTPPSKTTPSHSKNSSSHSKPPTSHSKPPTSHSKPLSTQSKPPSSQSKPPSSQSKPPVSLSSSGSSSTKSSTPVVSRDPRLAKLAAARETSPKLSQVSPAESSSSSSSTNYPDAKATTKSSISYPDTKSTSSYSDTKFSSKSSSSYSDTKFSSKSSSSYLDAQSKDVDEYEPEYIPMPVKVKSAYNQPIAEYIPTPTGKKVKAIVVEKMDSSPSEDDFLDKEVKSHRSKHHHHHHQHQHQQHYKEEQELKTVPEEAEEESDPYSPGKEAEPYSPGQEAEADEPYDPADESLMDEGGVPLVSSSQATVDVIPASASSARSASVSTNPAAPTIPAPTTPAPASMEVSGAAPGHTDEDECSQQELVEKMAQSNDPQQISALMVMALSVANSPLEQQQLLVELTKKVEQRKVQLVQLQTSQHLVGLTVGRPAIVDGRSTDLPELEAEQIPKTSALAPASQGIRNTDGEGPWPIGQLEAASSSAAENREASGDSHLPTETAKGAAVALEIPDALKALMKDVLGHTPQSTLETRRQLPEMKEEVRMEAATTREELGASGGQQQADVAVLMDQVDVLNILNTVKRLEQSGADDPVVSPESLTEEVGIKVETTPPSIDELLDKLKKGGFGFPLKMSDSLSPAPTLVPTPAPSDNLTEFVQSAVSDPTAATTTISSSSTSSSAFSSKGSLLTTSSMDTDMRQKDKPQTVSEIQLAGHNDSRPPLPPPPPPPPPPQSRGSSSIYQDRDDRIYQPPSAPKHPLDPFAFPPLPGYPPPRPSLLTSHGPLHPRFPLPSSDPHSHQPTSSTVPPSRVLTQPPPPGTEVEQLPGAVDDEDFRNRSLTSASCDASAPPSLSTQPPCPPLPGNQRMQSSHYPYQSSADVDYRQEASYRPPRSQR